MKKLLCLLFVLASLGTSAAVAADANALSARLASDQGRPQADKERDGNRKPAQVLAFLGVEPGMTVIDLVAAAGYYTEVLSHAVGANGRVYMQNTPSSFSGNRGARTRQAIDERLANNRLANVEELLVEPTALDLPGASIDAAIIALEFHELYLSDNANAAAEFLAEMRRVLKPGGVLGIIDHAGSPAFEPGPLHRALEARVVADAQAAGLFVADSARLLRNIDDDRSRSAFAEGLRGSTDRFVLKVIKRK